MLYFDNSATTAPYSELLENYQQIASYYYANPSSVHNLGVKAKQLLEQARQQVARILACDSKEIYFTSSGTEANNWVLQAVIKELYKMRPNAKRILISAIEHPSIIEQINVLKTNGYQVELIEVDEEGIIDLNKLKNQLDKDVLFISTMAVNNEVGSIQPLKAISNLLEKYPQTIWHVDAVQAITTQLSIIKEERIDALSLSGHKFHAVRGTGILMLRNRVGTQPFIYGGGQENGYRSGTENLASIVVTAKALRMAEVKQAMVKETLRSFRTSLITSFQSNGWQIFAVKSGSEHILCVALPSVPGEVLVHAFEAEDVMISTTSACSSRKHQSHHTLKAMGVADSISKSAVRISMSGITTPDEVNQLIAIIKTVTVTFNQR